MYKEQLSERKKVFHPKRTQKQRMWINLLLWSFIIYEKFAVFLIWLRLVSALSIFANKSDASKLKLNYSLLH